MTRLTSVNDKNWPEVEIINAYAIFMGYLMMGVRGLGLLVLTWTTVVLLGGFVSMLQKKDFWCLTVITLVQTAGVFDFLLKEKASDVGDSLKGMLGALFAVLFLQCDKHQGTSLVAVGTLATVLFVVSLVLQLLVLALVLCLVAVLYLLGLYISTGVSLWRLIEHDYGNAEGSANLKPALNILYSLSVAQGVVFCYKNIYDMMPKSWLVEEVANYYSLELDTAIVSDYLEETVTGCIKEPSFARGRNLVTYGVELLMESKSRHGYLSGVMIVGIIVQPINSMYRGQSGVVQQLLTRSASFSHMVQRLLEMIGPTSPYSPEIREHAARIVAHVAGSIRLEEPQFSGGTMIQCVSSLLNTIEEQGWRPEWYEPDSDMPKEYERDWLLEKHDRAYLRRAAGGGKSRIDNTLHGYRGLVVQGLRIFQGLAVHEDNCRVLISSSQGLVSKIMVPLVSDQLHGEHHDEWSSIAEESLEVMSRLMAAVPGGEIGRSKLRSEVIEGKIQEIITNLLQCRKCQVSLKRQAVKIVLGLSLDSCFDRMCGSVHLAKKSSYIRGLASEKLLVMLSSQSQANAMSMSILRSVGDVIGSLTRAAVDAKNHAYRLHAIQILEDLCRHYTKDDEHIKELKKHIADVMPKVLKEILGRRPTSEESQASSEDKHIQDSALDADLENGSAPHGHAQEQKDASSSQQENGVEDHEGIKLHEALISLCRAIPYHWAHGFDDLAKKACLEQGIREKDFYELLWYAELHLEEHKKAEGLALY